MKKIYLTLSFVWVAGIVCAQNKATKDADKLYDRLEYVNAAKAYLKLVESDKADAYVYTQLADSYYNVFNTAEAIKWYEKALETKPDAELHYKYAQMLKAEGNYDLSDAQMRKFATMKPNDDRAKIYLANPNYLPALKFQSKLFTIDPSNISSGFSDFGAVLTNDNVIYFTSSRNTSRKKNEMNKEPYLDIYKAIYNDDGTLSEPTLVDGINTKWHDGPVSVTADGNTMYFNSESFNENEFEKDKAANAKFGQMYIYKATRDGNSWKNAKPLSINNKSYSLRNPSISADGSTLYFSSDMPGGLGGDDIWKVSVNGNEYGTPENLGGAVNTAGNESFPFIADDNVLYFTSDARKGFGGFDIYKKDMSDSKEAVNLGEPVNTNRDDFSFTFNQLKNVALFSSNRDGVDNIYLASPVCGVETFIVVKDADGNDIRNATIMVFDSQNNIAHSLISDANGQTRVGLKCDEMYKFQTNRNGFENNTYSMDAQKNGEKLIEIILDPIVPVITEKEVILQAIYFDFDKSNITQEGAEELDKLVKVMNEYPDMVIFVKSHTDSRGKDKYNLNLSDRRAKSTVQYIISKGISSERLSGQGFGETEPKVACETCTEEEHEQNRRSEFLIVKK